MMGLISKVRSGRKKADALRLCDQVIAAIKRDAERGLLDPEKSDRYLAELQEVRRLIEQLPRITVSIPLIGLLIQIIREVLK